MDLVLVLLSAVAWMIVYIESIRLGFKQKTYCMPLFALMLNLVWEGLYFLTRSRTNPSIQSYVNGLWFALDIIIVVTYFRYGKKYFPDHTKHFFVPFSIISMITALMLQLAFYLQFPRQSASEYSSFLQNVVMSILFVVMLFRRNSKEGQSLVIAFAKWIGTLAPTILFGIMYGINIYIILCGALCSIFDILYLVLLWKWKTIGKE